MDLTHYKFQKGGLEVLKEAQIRIGANQKAEQVLGISAKELDPSRFKWKELGEEKNSTSKVSSKEETSTSFQVQVSVLGSPDSQGANCEGTRSWEDFERDSYHHRNQISRWVYLGEIGIGPRLDCS